MRPLTRRPHPVVAGALLLVMTALVGLAAVLIDDRAALIGSAVAAGLGGFVIAWLYARTAPQADGGSAGTLGRLEAAIARSTGDAGGDLVGRVEALARREDLYRCVFEALGSAALVLDSAGRVVVANPAAGRLLGSDPGDLVGLDPQALFTEADVHALCEQGARGEAASRRVRIVRAGSSGIFEGVAVPIDLSGERGVIVVLRDVTELALASELKTDFVGNASHELRTPIAAIRGAVDTLLGPARDDGPMRERLAIMIRDHVVRLEELVRDLLDLSRFEAPEGIATVAEVDCVSLCAEIETMLSTQRTERDVTLSFEFDPALRRLHTDGRALLLALRNLIDNAIKFSHPGGTVRVVGTVTENEPRAARIRVIDRGVGIPISQQTRIFERFYQVDQARSGATPSRGTGLGLAIVKHALRRLGGTIEVESVWNEGTTMTVEIPFEATGARSASQHPPGAG